MPPEQQPAVYGQQAGAEPVAYAAPQPVPAPFVPQGSVVSTDDSYASPGWSWGGFFLNIMFAVAIRKHWYLLFIIPMLVPVVNIVVILGLMIFLGLKGREMAAASPVFTNRDQYVGFMKAIDHAGKVFGIFYLVVIVVGISASIILASLSGARNQAREASWELEQSRIELENEMEGLNDEVLY